MLINIRLIVLLIIISTTLGCSTTKEWASGLFEDEDNADLPTPLVDFTTTLTVKRLWSKRLTKGSDELFIKLVPAVLAQKIFIADHRGNVVAADRDTGKLIWRSKTKKPITGGPGVFANNVIVGTSEGEVLSFDPETGEQRWQAKVSSEILATPKQADNIVIVRTVDGKLFALNATSGDRLWVYDRSVPSLTLRGTSAPTIAGEMVIAGLDSGRIIALELKTGKLIWEQRVLLSKGRTELERMIDIDAEPLVADDTVYVTNYQASLTALTLDSGRIIWQREIPSHLELATDEGNLYLTDDADNVWALDRYSGASIWKQDNLYARKITGPAVLGDHVIVGDFEGYLHWLNKQTGEFSARTQVTDAQILTQPITANGILLSYSSNGTLSAFSVVDKAALQSSVDN